MSFGCKCSCSSPRRVSNFNNNVPQRDRYLDYHYLKFERDLWNIFRVKSDNSRHQGLRAAAAVMLRP